MYKIRARSPDKILSSHRRPRCGFARGGRGRVRIRVCCLYAISIHHVGPRTDTDSTSVRDLRPRLPKTRSRTDTYSLSVRDLILPETRSRNTGCGPCASLPSRIIRGRVWTSFGPRIKPHRLWQRGVPKRRPKVRRDPGGVDDRVARQSLLRHKDRILRKRPNECRLRRSGGDVASFRSVSSSAQWGRQNKVCAPRPSNLRLGDAPLLVMLPGKDREESAMCQTKGKAKLKSKSKSKFEDGSSKEVNERNDEVRRGRAKQHNRLGSLLIYCVGRTSFN